MTTPTVAQVVQMRRPRVRPTLRGYFAERLGAQLELADMIAQPCPVYRDNPRGFAEDILGVDLWAKQDEILDAVRDEARVSVRSGHKIGKSLVAAVIALWFYFSFDDARVVLSSVTSRQVDQILWREIRKLRARAKHRIDGDIHELARSGLRADDFREIVGFTAKEAEAVAGISGANLLYVLDEASGIPEEIFEAIEGNRAGGARLVMFSNPTRTEGEFFRSHREKSIKVDKKTGKRTGFYKAIHVSSEETPNARAGRQVIPGLANSEWIEEKREEWGVDSPLYKVRVKGEFVENEKGKILSIHDIGQAEARWEETPAEGRLYVGLDPAGPGGGGDQWVFAPRRGLKVLGLYAFNGLSDEAAIAHLLGILKDHRREREPKPVVVIDAQGPIGGRIAGKLQAITHNIAKGPNADTKGFEIVLVYPGKKLPAHPQAKHGTVRDQLWWRLQEWITKEGGAIPEDARLARELHAPSWEEIPGTGRVRATAKSVLRTMLDNRSPDRADGVCLSVWESPEFAAGAADGDEQLDEDVAGDDVGDGGIDPYAGTFGSNGINPYGGAEEVD